MYLFIQIIDGKNGIIRDFEVVEEFSINIICFVRVHMSFGSIKYIKEVMKLI